VLDVPLNNAKMGLGALGEPQMRSRGANGWSHTSFLSPVPPSRESITLDRKHVWSKTYLR